jgi:hypothetical protein
VLYLPTMAICTIGSVIAGITGANGMNDMAGNAARVTVERSGSCQDTTLSSLLVDLECHSRPMRLARRTVASDFSYDAGVAETAMGGIKETASLH